MVYTKVLERHSRHCSALSAYKASSLSTVASTTLGNDHVTQELDGVQYLLGAAVVGLAVVGLTVHGAAVVGFGVTGAAVVGAGVAVRENNRTRRVATQGSVA